MQKWCASLAIGFCLAFSAVARAQDAGAAAAAAALAAGATPNYVLAPKPLKLPGWIAPNRPHWKLADILRAHAGQKSWDQPLVRDRDNVADYVQMAPGEVSKTRLYAQTSMFWIVEAGQMRVFIQGQEPFIAAMGFVVWIQPRTQFHMETVGNAPVLRFEVARAGAPPLYAVSETPPSPPNGERYTRVAYIGGPVPYATAKPYVDFFTEIVQRGGNNLRFLPQGNFLRGKGVAMPPDSDLGHFHTDHNEFWFMMEGDTNFKFEGMPAFTATQGDVVYGPQGRFHRPSFGGDGMSTRLSIAPSGNMAILDPNGLSR